MKKLMQFSVLVICSLGLFGCPYESQVPISDPYIPIDSRLIGEWNSKDEVYNNYTVTVASETEYHIVQRNTIGNISTYKGFLSEIKGVMFMNLYSDSSGAYYLYRLKMDNAGNKFTLMPLAENLPEHFGSKDGLRNYLEKSMNLQSIYNSAENTEFQKIPLNMTGSLN